MPLAEPASKSPVIEQKARLLIVSDAWWPQVNGVARTMEWLRAELVSLGVGVAMLTPEGFRTAPMPSYPSIRLALATPGAVARVFAARRPAVVHIATEGPLGFLARRHCLRSGVPFTTCYHTRFPEYIAARFPVPLSWSYAALRRFHAGARATMVSTESLRAELEGRGFRNLVQWRRGVPLRLFAEAEPAPRDWPRPVFLYVGRVAVEKNLDAFLKLDLPGSKVVVGDGPARESLSRCYPSARFLGRLDGAELAAAYASADAFVFPSLTDTYGLVLVEALAAGVPVAAFPVPGPLDIVGDSGCGALNEDLRAAALAALEIPRARCKAFALGHGIRASAKRFLENITAATGVDLVSGIDQAAG